MMAQETTPRCVFLSRSFVFSRHNNRTLRARTHTTSRVVFACCGVVVCSVEHTRTMTEMSDSSSLTEDGIPEAVDTYAQQHTTPPHHTTPHTTQDNTHWLVVVVVCRFDVPDVANALMPDVTEQKRQVQAMLDEGHLCSRSLVAEEVDYL